MSSTPSALPRHRPPSPPRPLPENHAQELQSGRYWGRAYAVGDGAPIGGAYINWDLHSVVLKSVSVSAAALPRRRVFCGAPDPSWELAPVAELGDPGYAPPARGARAYVGRRLEEGEREAWEASLGGGGVEPLTPLSSDAEEEEQDVLSGMPSNSELPFVIAKLLADTGASLEAAGTGISQEAAGTGISQEAAGAAPA